jgi:hypothetical protein
MSAVAAPADFADWINPVTVKELRQGMRTHVFTGVMLAVHGMLVAVATAIAFLWNPMDTEASAKLTMVFTGGFWTCASLLLLVAQPLRAINALGGEVTAGTFELILLSRQTPRRITFGKWLAIFLQSLILGFSLIPYALLRYFLGGVELSVELPAGVSLLASSAFLTAAALHLSTSSVAARCLVPILTAPAYAFCGCTGMVSMAQMFEHSSGPGTGLLAAVWAAPLASIHVAFLVTAFLNFATSSRFSRHYRTLDAEPGAPRFLVSGTIGTGAALVFLSPAVYLTTLAGSFGLALALTVGTGFTRPLTGIRE